jgi:hypothetical protein
MAAPSPSQSMQQSSSATSGAYGAPVTTAGTIGDFNFKSASGAGSVGGVSPLVLAGVALAAAVVWTARRK